MAAHSHISGSCAGAHAGHPLLSYSSWRLRRLREAGLCPTLIKMPAVAESCCQDGTWRGAAGMLQQQLPHRHGSPTAVLAL